MTKLMTAHIVKHAFEITGKSPLQVLLNAIINRCPWGRLNRLWMSRDQRLQAVGVSLPSDSDHPSLGKVLPTQVSQE